MLSKSLRHVTFQMHFHDEIQQIQGIREVVKRYVLNLVIYIGLERKKSARLADNDSLLQKGNGKLQ